MPRPFNTPIRLVIAAAFILIASSYLAFVIATDGLASAIVPAIGVFVMGFSAVGYWLSRS